MHTSVLQAVAWAKMTIDFARHETIEVSLEKTFDGRHPCPICLSLKKADGPTLAAAAPAHGRLGSIVPTAAPCLVRAIASWDVAAAAKPMFERVLSPAAPPPKTVVS
jgi:hypothetical protein